MTHQSKMTRRSLLSTAAVAVPAIGLVTALDVTSTPKAHAAPSVGSFVNAALSCRGCPYVFGAAGPWEFDCSGLIYWSLGHIGVSFPRTSGQQYSACHQISRDQALATYGALLWKPGHIAISLGDGTTMEARDERSGVNVFNAYDIHWHAGGLIPSISYGGGGGGGGLNVDGYWGSATTRRLQEVLGTTADGVVSSQAASWKSKNPGLASGWEWVSDAQASGSPVIKALQSKVGAGADGLIGPATIRAIQSHYGTTVDGYFSEGSSCIMAMQRALNSGGV